MINWSIHSHGRLLPPNPFPEQQRIYHVCGTEQSVEDRQRLPVVHSTVPQIRGGFRIFHSGCWTAAVPEEGVALDNIVTYFVYIIIIVMNITHILPHTFSWYFSYPTLLLMSKMGGGAISTAYYDGVLNNYLLFLMLWKSTLVLSVLALVLSVFKIIVIIKLLAMEINKIFANQGNGKHVW